MGKRERDQLRAQINQLNNELDRIQSGDQEYQFSNDNGKEFPIETGYLDEKNENADNDLLMMELQHRKYAGKRNTGKAYTMSVDETKDSLTEEDVLLYQLRKRYSDLSEDKELERLEKRGFQQVSVWDEETVKMSAGSLYLQIGNHLQKGQISDKEQHEMIMLSQSKEEAAPGLKQFYSAFTVLQSDPSRRQMVDIWRKIRDITSSHDVDEGVRILAQAIRMAGEKQDTINAEKDQKNRERQQKFDRIRERTKSEYESAKNEADRWRKKDQ